MRKNNASIAFLTIAVLLSMNVYQMAFSRSPTSSRLPAPAELNQELQKIKKTATPFGNTTPEGCFIVHKDGGPFLRNTIKYLHKNELINKLFGLSNEQLNEREILTSQAVPQARPMGGNDKIAATDPLEDNSRENSLFYCPQRNNWGITSFTYNSLLHEGFALPLHQIGQTFYVADPSSNALDVILSIIHETSIKFDSGIVFDRNNNITLHNTKISTYDCQGSDKARLYIEYSFNTFRAFVKEEQFLSLLPPSESAAYYKFPLYQAFKKLRLAKDNNSCLEAFRTMLPLLDFLPESSKSLFSRVIEKDPKVDCLNNAVWHFRGQNNGTSNGGPRPLPRGG